MRRLDRRFLALLATGFVSAMLLAQTSAPEEEKPMNILFIGQDDLRPELGCYGAEHVHTPNIDRLAAEGLVFERAYVQQAICAASRASFLTGVRPDTTGVNYPYTAFFVEDFLGEHPTIQSFFHEQGYYARTFGKIHHGAYVEHLSEPHFWPESSSLYALRENVDLRSSGAPPPATESADVPDAAYHDGAIADEVIATIGRASKQDRPFFLSVGFLKPHLPFCAPEKYWDLYSREDIELSPIPEHPTGVPSYSTSHAGLHRYAGPDDADGRRVPDEFASELRHGYYACISFVDEQIGRVLDELHRLGLREDTIVVFWSDHGWHLGDHAMWGKRTNFELATRSPLIVSVPAMRNRGERSSALVEYVDLFPTLAELAGLPALQHFEGTSLVPLLHEPERPWKKAAFHQYPRRDERGRLLEGYAIRTDRYRYVEWRMTGRRATGEVLSRELYDHESDPLESRNMADDARHEALVERLAAQLADGWKAALPTGVVNLSANVAAPRSGKWVKENSREWAKRGWARHASSPAPAAPKKP